MIKICENCAEFRRKHEDALLGRCDRDGTEARVSDSCDRWKSLHHRDYREERMDTR